MNFAGTDANVDTNPEYLSRLAASRRKAENGEKPGAYSIRTWPSNVLFNLAKPQESDVRIEDIAHALSMLCRFGGHCPKHWSVAQHSVLVAYLASCNGLPREHYGAALLHDAHEAYMQDVTSPAKRLVGRSYTNPADDIQACIHRALGIPQLNCEAVSLIKQADSIALDIEQAAIAAGDMVARFATMVQEEEWHHFREPQSPGESRVQFLAEWNAWRSEFAVAST